MLESIIFHFVFVLFALWAFVWWLMTKRKLEILRQALIPALLLKTIEFPQDRSIVVRSINYLQEELANLFHCRVLIEFNFSKLSLTSEKGFFNPLCYLIVEKKNKVDKKFLLRENLYSSAELFSYLDSLIKKEDISFSYNFEKDIWSVEIRAALTKTSAQKNRELV